MKKICKFCKKLFDVPLTNPNQKFCSRDCGYKNRRYRPQPYSVKTLCSCGCGSIILNPDDHYRYRKFLAEHRNSNGTHPRKGFKESDEHTRNRISKMFKRFKTKTPTCLEKELYKFLNDNKIYFISQKQIGRTCVDAFIPVFNLCIYADGNYWHSKPEVKKRDAKISKSLKEKGYKVLRLKSKDNGYHLNIIPLKKFIYSGAMP